MKVQLKKIVNDRDNCPYCDSNKHKEIYKGKKKHKYHRVFKRLGCLDCGHKYIAESDKEFNQRIEEYETD
jgi:cytochrome c-type biogenesis protein CcmH/NrfF